jgi:hypothetical protein
LKVPVSLVISVAPRYMWNAHDNRAIFLGSKFHL